MANKKAKLLILVLPLVLVLLFAFLTWREVRQSRLNHALIVALQRGEIDRMAALLRQGADPNARNTPAPALTWHMLLDRWLRRSKAPDAEDTALIIATRNRNQDEVFRLLRAGANPNTASEGVTPLAIALNDDEPVVAIIRSLINHGANPNARMIDTQTSTSTTPLIKAIQGNFSNAADQSDLVELMLEHGADVQATDANGTSPLLLAASQGETEIAHSLIKRGADINHTDQNGSTPLSACVDDWAGKSGQPILNELLRRGVDITPAHNGGFNLLNWAAKNENITVLQTALARGIPVNSQGNQKRTPLMIAAAFGNIAAAKILLAHGAFVDTRDANGWTALMFAAQHGDVAMIQVLLRHGANPALRDHERGWTAAQRAAWVGQEQVAHWLQEKKPSLVSSPPAPEPTWRDEDRTEEPVHLTVDDHRTVIFSLRDRFNYKAVVMNDRGRHGRPYPVFQFVPHCRVFADTDGRRYAWFLSIQIASHQITERDKLVKIDNLELREWGKRDFTYMEKATYCQRLAGGGALLIAFHYRRVNFIPAGHQCDAIGKVTLFRNGKLKDVGMIFMPEGEGG
jgi:ankyrin repeat protein